MDDHLAWLTERRPHFDELIGGVSHYAIFMLSADGHILDWNAGAAALLGHSADEIIGQHLSVFYSEEDRKAGVPDRVLENAASAGSFVTEGWRHHRSGHRFWANVTVTPIRAPDGSTAGYLNITRHLSERQARMEKLRESEERMKLLIESVTEYAIFMLDPQGFIISWNSGARRIKGYEADEVIGTHFSRFYTAEARSLGVPGKLLARALEAGSAEDEGWRVRKDGQTFWASVVITAVRRDNGDHHGFVKITRDLTERRRAEELSKAQERKDLFLATLAHELRNPLAPLAPGLEILLRSPDDSARVTRVASMMLRQVNQMSRLIEDLVDVSRLTTGKIPLRPEVVSLTEILDTSLDSIRPMLDAGHHRLTLDLPPGRVEVAADPPRLIQALSNLLTNAVKYTEAPGEITLSVKVREPKILEISVRDTGRGIPAAQLDHVFEIFHRGAEEKTDGLGIGLSLVRTIAELHGGTITATSEGRDRGSEFVLTLPIVSRCHTGSSPKSPVGVAGARCRVLVVDDARATADTLALFLEEEGLEAAVAYDGEAAVETAKKIRPDIGCLDIGLPGIDGLETARQIRKLVPNIVLIAITGWGSDRDRAGTAAAGFDFHMVKPVKIDELREVLQTRAGHCFRAPRSQ